ncbi:hypothetical protein COCON_G00200290 [Conger conger]|uniref:Uncharacterized protein n=1 Tax=Conger conger TaxID=82655 RepID=A0A9Q1D259_CONCO|nr:hypothetical protein COCON_G00200290 [Conger conger]
MDNYLCFTAEAKQHGSHRRMASTMAWCTRLSAVLLLTSLQMNGKFTKATRFEGINPALIKLKVRQGSDGINVTWNRPNKKITHTCYDTNLQYRSQCGSDWLNFVLHSFSFVLGDLGRGCGRNYTFRARMRYACLYRSWSPWSPEKHWTEETVSASCFKAKPNLHLLISLIPAIFLLGLLMAQKPIRRLILSKVPDPKHIYDDLLKIDQSQLEQTFKDHNAECETFKIEIVQPEKEVEEEQSKQSADAGPGSGLGFAMTPFSKTAMLTEKPWRGRNALPQVDETDNGVVFSPG